VLWQRWLSFILAVFLAGCVRYEPQPLRPQQLESAFRARTLADAGLREFVETNFPQPPLSWPPAAFDLKSLTLAALYFHPDLQLARARVATARAAEITAGARPNPTAALLPTWVVNSFPGETPWLFGASVDVPIETAGKRRRRLELARALTADARLGFSETAWEVRSRLRQALVEYFCAQRALELFGAEAQTQSQLTNLLQKRLEAGETSRFELTVARTQSLNAAIAVRAAQTRLADARQAVASALGLPAAALEKTTLAWPQFDEPPADISTAALQSAAVLGRVDVARALAQYAAAEAVLRLEIARQYPDIHLDPGYEFDQGEHKFSLGPSISLPILDRNQGPIAEAKAKREAAAANFLAVQTAAIQEMEKAATDYHAALAEWAGADQMARTLQQELAKAAEQQVRAGEGDRLSLFYAQLQREAVERARLETLRKVQDALGALEDAMRRPLFDEEDWHAFQRFENYHPPKQTP
jgi:outer membrane protein TolC